MPVAEIIAIGTELLLGDTQDTNTRYLAHKLKSAGIDLYRTTIIGDNESRIAQVIRESINRADIVITTGGLGPTIDDPTRQAVALALGIKTEYRPDLWEQIIQRFENYNRVPTENNRRQAFVPEGSIALKNDVGTAPAFICEHENTCIISLPGVPREMEHILDSEVLPLLHDRFDLHNVIITHYIHLSGVGESQVDMLISDLEKLVNPTVGLSAHSGQIDVRVTAKAPTRELADQMIQSILPDLRERLAAYIFGENEDTLASVISRSLKRLHLDLAVLESGLDGALSEHLSEMLPAAAPKPGPGLQPQYEDLLAQMDDLKRSSPSVVVLAAHLTRLENRHLLSMVFSHLHTTNEKQLSYGGPPGLAASWAATNSMDFVYRSLKHLEDSNQPGKVTLP
jgi:competence/damage-inducible protein CinA-like protein